MDPGSLLGGYLEQGYKAGPVHTVSSAIFTSAGPLSLLRVFPRISPPVKRLNCFKYNKQQNVEGYLGLPCETTPERSDISKALQG